MLFDLPAAEFCRSSDIGELAGIEFPATRANLYMFKFRDCWVDVDKAFPIAAGLQTCKALFRTYADHKYGEYYSGTFAAELQAHTSVDHEDVFVLGGSDNYWHFLVDHLGKISLLRYFETTPPPLIITQRLPPEFVQLIALACVFLRVPRPEVVSTARPILRLRNSFVPCVNDTAPRLRFLRALGVAIQAPASASVAPERIFLRRGAVAQRRVRNEDELAEGLVRNLGFVVAEPGSMSILEQINLVKNARIIVGGHGAALTNLIFAPKLNSMVELFVGHTQPFFKSACDHLDVAHYFVRGDAVGSQDSFVGHDRQDNQDYSVPACQLMTLVETISRDSA
jgi:capsular polysaccharide biosynthesis protein